MYGAAEFPVKRVEECRTLAWFANPELQLEPADLSSRLGMWSYKISSKIASHTLIPHKGLCKYRKCSIHFRVFHVCETWLIWEPTMIIFLCVVYGGPPQRPSLVLWQASENWCLGQCELLPSDCPGFREFWRDDRDGCTCASSQRLERCRCVLPLYIVWFTLVSQYRIYVYWYIIYNVYIYYDATCYSYLIFMFLFPACHDILLFDMWHFKESKSSAS